MKPASTISTTPGHHIKASDTILLTVRDTRWWRRALHWMLRRPGQPQRTLSRFVVQSSDTTLALHDLEEPVMQGGPDKLMHRHAGAASWFVFGALWVSGLALGDQIKAAGHDFSGSWAVLYGGMWMLLCVEVRKLLLALWRDDVEAGQ
jgi:hypothetical protein